MFPPRFDTFYLAIVKSEYRTGMEGGTSAVTLTSSCQRARIIALLPLSKHTRLITPCRELAP